MNQIIAGLFIILVPLSVAGFTGLGIVTIFLIDTKIKPRIISFYKEGIIK